MKALKVKTCAGAQVQIVELFGDPKKQPEPIYLRIKFPGGEVNIARTPDNDYWVHVEKSGIGKVTDARLDIRGRNSSEVNTGDFAHPDLYHLAVRVART